MTETTVITETTTVTEERYKPQNPEAMNETMFSDSEVCSHSTLDLAGRDFTVADCDWIF